MVKVFSGATGAMWVDTVDPGVSETHIQVGNFWLNSSTNILFMCKDATIGAQIWQEYPTATVTVAKGGTGATTLTDHGVLVGSGTSAIDALSVGSTGTVLTGVTGADPAFSATPSVTSVAIGTGALTITSGTGAPGSSQPKGSLYLRTDGGGVNDRMYVAIDAVGGWTAVVTLA